MLYERQMIFPFLIGCWSVLVTKTLLVQSDPFQNWKINFHIKAIINLKIANKYWFQCCHKLPIPFLVVSQSTVFFGWISSLFVKLEKVNFFQVLWYEASFIFGLNLVSLPAYFTSLPCSSCNAMGFILTNHLECTQLQKGQVFY